MEWTHILGFLTVAILLMVSPGPMHCDALSQVTKQQVSREIFADKKPAYYQFAGAVRAINNDFIYQHFPHVKPLD